MPEELPGFGVNERASSFRQITDDIPIRALAFRALEHDMERHHCSAFPLEPFLFRLCHRLGTVNKLSIHRISETRRHFTRLLDFAVLHVHLVTIFCLRRMEENAPLLCDAVHVP